MHRSRVLANLWLRFGTLLLLGPLAATRIAAQPADAAAPRSAPASAADSKSASATPATTAEPHYRLLESRLTAREPFNAAADKVRVVAFLSPSCARCLKNAGELHREVLEKDPTADLAVFMIWLKVMDKDDEAAVAAATARYTDPRITHYWDPQRILNAQLLDAVTFDVNVRLYDVFLLYDRKSAWEKRLPRPGYWMHEYRGTPGPWWNITTFAAEIAKGLRGEPFTPPLD